MNNFVKASLIAAMMSLRCMYSITSVKQIRAAHTNLQISFSGLVPLILVQLRAIMPVGGEDKKLDLIVNYISGENYEKKALFL